MALASFDGTGASRLALSVYSLGLTHGRAAATLTCGAGRSVHLVARGHRSPAAVLRRLAPDLAAAVTGGASDDGRTCTA